MRPPDGETPSRGFSHIRFTSSWCCFRPPVSFRRRPPDFPKVSYRVLFGPGGTLLLASDFGIFRSWWILGVTLLSALRAIPLGVMTAIYLPRNIARRGTRGRETSGREC